MLSTCFWSRSLLTFPYAADIELIKVVREELVELLLYNLRHVPGINMAHVFLGYATVDSGVEAPFTPFEGRQALAPTMVRVSFFLMVHMPLQAKRRA